MCRIIDISQEVFSCKIFPNDPSPKKAQVLSIKSGDMCNLTEFSMCAHNGTHVDAPFHFIDSGKTIDQMGLEPFTGDCFVARHEGDVTADDAKEIMGEEMYKIALEGLISKYKEIPIKVE